MSEEQKKDLVFMLVGNGHKCDREALIAVSDAVLELAAKEAETSVDSRHGRALKNSQFIASRIRSMKSGGA